MATTVIEFRVELHGNGEVTRNGVALESGGNPVPFEEKIFSKRLNLQQQHEVICDLSALLAKMTHAYKEARVRHNELAEEQGRLRPTGRFAR